MNAFYGNMHTLATVRSFTPAARPPSMRLLKVIWFVSRTSRLRWQLQRRNSVQRCCEQRQPRQRSLWHAANWTRYTSALECALLFALLGVDSNACDETACTGCCCFWPEQQHFEQNQLA